MSSNGTRRAGVPCTRAPGAIASALGINHCVGCVHVQSLKYAAAVCTKARSVQAETEHSAAPCRVRNYCGGVSWHTGLLPRVPGARHCALAGI